MAAETASAPKKIRRSGVSYFVRQRGNEWHVCLGNEIIGRHKDEAAADDHLRSILRPTGAHS